MNLDNLPADQLSREIAAMREQIDAMSPPRTMLESYQRERLLLKLFALQDEETRRAHAALRAGSNRARTLRQTWMRRKPNRKPTAADKLNREADLRLSLALGVP